MMSISTSRVQSGGGGLMQQMSAEVVDLYKHFENLTQTRRQVDLMEREQNAAVMSDHMNRVIKERGGLRNMLASGPEARLAYGSYLHQTTGMKPGEVEGFINSMSALPPAEADMVHLLSNQAARGDQEAMRRLNNLSQVGLAMDRSGGQSITPQMFKTLVDQAAKETFGLDPREFEQRAEGGEMPSQPEQPEAEVNTTRMEPPKAEQRSEPTRFSYPGAAFDRRQMEERGERAPGTGQPERQPQQPQASLRIGGGNVAGLEEARGSVRERAPEMSPLELEYTSEVRAGRISPETSIERFQAMKELPNIVSKAGESAREAWLDAREKQIKRAKGDESITIEELSDSRDRVVQQVEKSQLRDRVTSTGTQRQKDVIEQTAEAIPEEPNPQKLVENASQMDAFRGRLNELLNQYTRTIASTSSMRSVERDYLQGKKIPESKRKLAVRQESDRLVREDLKAVETWYQNLVETGAANNPAYLRRVAPDIAKEVDEVNSTLYNLGMLDVQRGQLELNRDQFLYQQALEQMMMKRQEELERLQGETPGGVLPFEIWKDGIKSYASLMEKALAEGYDEKEFQELVKSDPWFTAVRDSAEFWASSMGIKLSQAEKDVGFFASLWRKAFGGEGTQTFSTQLFGGSAQAPTDQGVRSSEVESVTNKYIR